ncbi:MAG: carbohydrate kinase family protein, partial [Gammaproteobacteria bacterium]
AELIGLVPGARFADVTSDTLLSVPLDLAVGGTAANFAIAAVEHFAEVHLIGRVGTDPVADLISAGLAAAGVHGHLIRDPACSSGLAAVLRDADPHRQRGTRLMLISPNSANIGLTAAEIDPLADVLAGMDALVADGYAMLSEPRRSATLQAMAIVAAAGGQVIFDVVPHDSFRRYDIAELHRLTASATIIIAEVRTLCGFLGAIDQGGYYDLDRAVAALPDLIAAFGDRTLFLRFGFGNANETLHVEPGRDHQHRHTRYTDTAETVGFGDRLAARELSEYLSALASRESNP